MSRLSTTHTCILLTCIVHNILLLGIGTGKPAGVQGQTRTRTRTPKGTNGYGSYDGY